MTLTLPCPQTTTHRLRRQHRATVQPADLRSAAALRAAVTQVHAEGWDNPTGRALLDALAVTCQRLAVRVEASAHLAHDSSRATTCCPTPGN